MLAEPNTDRPEPMTLDESYATAVGSSNLRVEADRRTPADMVIAAGMNPHRTGMLLLRLLEEWDKSSKPEPPAPAHMDAIAKTLRTEPALLAGGMKNPHAGLVRVEGERRGEVEYLLPGLVAQRMAAGWHEQELGLLLMNLKSGAAVRDALTFWAKSEGFVDGVHLVAPVLLWWLSPKCRMCGGIGKRIAKGTNRATGQPCGVCRGKGESRVPHGPAGRALLSYIKECRNGAKKGFGDKFRPEEYRRRAQRMEIVIQIGERWRSRDGRMWDISGEESHRESVLFFALEAASQDKVLFRRNGRPFTTMAFGPSGLDLIELVPRSDADETSCNG